MDPTQSLHSTDQFLRTLAVEAAAFLPNLVVAVIILAVGFALAGWLSRTVARLFGLSRIDQTVRGPLVAMVRYIVIILTLLVALSQLGVKMTSLLAVLGAAGLAVGLALQGTLTNIAAGIMLVWLRPFRVGDYIETQLVAGRVREIGLFVCHLETYDGLFVFAPNSVLWNVWMRNHSRAGARLLAWQVTLPRTVAFEEARTILESLGNSIPAGDNQPLSRPEIFLDQLSGGNQILVFRIYVSEGAIGSTQRSMAGKIRTHFAERFGSGGEPQAIQRLVPTDTDPSRYLADREAPTAGGDRTAGSRKGDAVDADGNRGAETVKASEDTASA